MRALSKHRFRMWLADEKSILVHMLLITLLSSQSKF